MFQMLVVAVALGIGCAAWADPLASYRAGGHVITLMTEPCAKGKNKSLKQARKGSGARLAKGCWSVNSRGNPVVTWKGGAVQELNAARVRLQPRYAALLRDIDLPAATDRKAISARRPFQRPSWCRHARQPHEILVCGDPDLSAEDIKLGWLWQSYRTELKLGRADQARHKDEFYRRLKACGATRACVAGAQAERIRFYRKALGIK